MVVFRMPIRAVQCSTIAVSLNFCQDRWRLEAKLLLLPLPFTADNGRSEVTSTGHVMALIRVNKLQRFLRHRYWQYSSKIDRWDPIVIVSGSLHWVCELRQSLLIGEWSNEKLYTTHFGRGFYIILRLSFRQQDILREVLKFRHHSAMVSGRNLHQPRIVEVLLLSMASSSKKSFGLTQEEVWCLVRLTNIRGIRLIVHRMLINR